MNKSPSLLKLIGNTPVVKLNKITKGLKCSIYGKLESYNPSGSIKDRVALHIIEAEELRGNIKPGDLIVEATSGNMGVSFALVAAIMGYRCIFTLPYHSKGFFIVYLNYIIYIIEINNPGYKIFTYPFNLEA